MLPTTILRGTRNNPLKYPSSLLGLIIFLRQKRSRSSQREREGGSSNGWKDGREGQAGDVFNSSDQLGAENWLEFAAKIYIYTQNIGI